MGQYIECDHVDCNERTTLHDRDPFMDRALLSWASYTLGSRTYDFCPEHTGELQHVKDDTVRAMIGGPAP